MEPSILIVDDDPLFRRTVRALLTARGYVVVGEAGGAVEGFALASALRPDAVLLDVNLPDGDGLAAAARLSADGRTRVVLISSDPTAAPERLLRHSGAAGFLPKEDLGGRALEEYLTR
jgi:DNA-binding NarL/FixJ family response regulator